LTPLTTDDEDWKALSGISVEAGLSFFESGKKKAETQGALLFTHFGFSGPAALDISRHWAVSCASAPTIHANFIPHETPESLRKHFEEFQKNHPRKMLKSFLVEALGLPERFSEIFLKKAGEKKFLHLLLNYPLPVTGVVGYKKAEVTAGGVDLKEVKVSSLESALVPGLYFAGEILDMDGRIGGFNFQWAWATGYVAGTAIGRLLK
jgi:predicted Rossmann fold flavoprotein